MFGNQGALFMNALTWWDHQTESVWSQPWGTALEGPLKDTALTLIPASIVPWETWRQEHPDTTVLSNDQDGFTQRVRGIRDDFVIGVALGDAATAYDYRTASQERVINDAIGAHPVVVMVDPDTRDIRVYLRRIALQGGKDTRVLTFELDSEGRVADAETGTVWSAQLQQVPWVSSFDWAWEDFFPHTSFYAK